MALTTFDIPQSWDDLVMHDGLPVGESAANMHALCAAICERYGATGANPPFTPPCVKGRMPSWDLAVSMMDAVRALYEGLSNMPRYLNPGTPYTPREAEYAEGEVPDWRWQYDNSLGLATWLNEVRPSDLDNAGRNYFAALPARGAPARDWGEWMRRMKNALDFLHVREVKRFLYGVVDIEARSSAAGAASALGALQDHVSAGIANYSPRANVLGRYRSWMSPPYSEHAASASTARPSGYYRLRLEDLHPYKSAGFGGFGELDLGISHVLGVRDAWPAYASARLRLLVYERQYGTYSIRYPGPYTQYQNPYDHYNYVESERIREIDCGTSGAKIRATVETGIGMLSPTPHEMPTGDEVGDIHSVEQRGAWSVEGFLDFGISGGFRYYDAPATT